MVINNSGEHNYGFDFVELSPLCNVNKNGLTKINNKIILEMQSLSMRLRWNHVHI